ncbi:MAG: hypothetical protein AAFU85_17145 [Planctomycetota bacterium]
MSQVVRIARDEYEPPLERDAWLRCIETREGLVRPPSKLGRSPATGQPILLHPSSACAHLFANEVHLVTLDWGQSEDECAVYAECLPADPETALNLIEEIADSLQCKMLVLPTRSDVPPARDSALRRFKRWVIG